VRDAVANAIRQAADTAIVPRYQTLARSDISEKLPGDYVTIADRECEQLLVELLDSIDPGTPVLGEEAAATDPELTQRLLAHERLWVIDPLDGTGAFMRGEPDFAVMVALIEKGETTAAWIWQPVPATMVMAVRGSGTTVDGVPVLRLPASDRAAGELHGVVKLGFWDDDTRRVVAANLHHFAGAGSGPAAAGFAYPQLVDGTYDFLVFWRTLPWDHAPGVLIAQESGCHVARLDGSHYRPGQARGGLLAAADEITWVRVRDRLMAS
jgi:fructose-1,6-bisphosphatase/inositol monophosphatase family enzyme